METEYKNNTTNWKILYKISSTDTLNKKKAEVEDKITKYNTAEKYQTISFSYDSYSPQESFITIHGVIIVKDKLWD
jgi:hypothetical protein